MELLGGFLVWESVFWTWTRALARLFGHRFGFTRISPQKGFCPLRGGSSFTDLVDAMREIVELLADYPCEIRLPFGRVWS